METSRIQYQGCALIHEPLTCPLEHSRECRHHQGPLCRSLGASFASTSSHEHSSRSSEEVLQSEKRQRVNIDYVAMNSEMFGDDEDEDSDKDYG